MAEPENHTLPLLREIREDIRRLDQKVEKNIAELKDITDGLMQTVSSELAIRGYIVNGVEERLAKIEQRLTTIESANRPER